jgi:hypothetical protein
VQHLSRITNFKGISNMNKKKMIVSGILLFASASVMAATSYYAVNMGTRTVSAAFEQPIDGVVVYMAGVKNGVCTPPKALVGTMNFVSGTSITNEILGGLNIGIGKQYSVAASAKQNTSSTTPAVYQYKFTDTSLTQFHYNVVYFRGATKASVKQVDGGWYPDNGGGCTYPIP